MASNILNMRFLIGLLLLFTLPTQAQWKSFALSPQGDTLNRVDKKDLRQGPWVVEVAERMGEPGYEEQGLYANGLKEGEWKRFSFQGVKLAEEVYRWGLLNGKQRYYTPFGGLARVESWRAIDPAKAFDTVYLYDLNDPSKVIGTTVVKNDGVSLRHGVWTYHDPRTGKLQDKIEYVMNRVKEEQTEAGESVLDMTDPRKRPAYRPTVDSLGNKKIAKPGVIQDYEKKNSGKKSIRVRDGSTGGY
jgi:antitoxin component YwqK of YwqJK toxin-antitoxin module